MSCISAQVLMSIGYWLLSLLAEVASKACIAVRARSPTRTGTRLALPARFTGSCRASIVFSPSWNCVVGLVDCYRCCFRSLRDLPTQTFNRPCKQLWTAQPTPQEVSATPHQCVGGVDRWVLCAPRQNNAVTCLDTLITGRRVEIV